MPDNSDITQEIITSFSGIRFANSIDVDNYFQTRQSQHYIRWFNATLAGHGPWTGVQLVDTPQNDVGFHQFWNQIDHMFGGDISLVQYVCLMSIISNEVRGDFKPRTEKMGIAGHPGMAYLFDRIGQKRSYNTLQGNKTAFECFNDENYIGAHGSLPLGGQLARTTDDRWSGEVWPAESPTNPDPSVTGFITQADFMKFRGRGFIQTTGRSNYLPLVDFIQKYDGANSTLDFFQHRWSEKTPDEAATISTNSDWDTLFQQTDLIVAAEAICLHDVNSGGYLNLSSDPTVLNGTGPGSVFFMGLRISGGQAYATTFKQRVTVVLAAI